MESQRDLVQGPRERPETLKLGTSQPLHADCLACAGDGNVHSCPKGRLLKAQSWDDDVEPRVPAQPEPRVGTGSLSMRRLIEKLSDRFFVREKLHLKHYHMSPAQFRHRTSELHLPSAIHD